MNRTTHPEPLFGWSLIAGIVVVYDAWALATGHVTLSEQFRLWFDRYMWFRVLSVAILALMTLHLYIGVLNNNQYLQRI